MEKIHQILQKVCNIAFWQNLINHFQWVDWVTVIFLAWGFIYGMRKGLMREIVELIEILLIIFVTNAYHPLVVSFLATYLTAFTERMLTPLAFMLTAVCVWFVVFVLDRVAQNWVHAKLSGVVKLLGGAFLGMIQFFLIWSFVSQAMLILPPQQIRLAYEEGHAVTGPWVKQAVPRIYAIVSKYGQPTPKA